MIKLDQLPTWEGPPAILTDGPRWFFLANADQSPGWRDPRARYQAEQRDAWVMQFCRRLSNVGVRPKTLVFIIETLSAVENRFLTVIPE